MSAAAGDPAPLIRETLWLRCTAKRKPPGPIDGGRSVPDDRGKNRRSRWLWLVPSVLVLAFIVVHIPLYLGYQSEWRVCEHLTPAGGYCRWSDSTPPWPLRHFGKGYSALYKRITGVLFRDGIARDQDIAQLKSLSSLETVLIEDAQITDEGLAQLAAIAELREVVVGETLIMDEAIAIFQKGRPAVKVRRQSTP